MHVDSIPTRGFFAGGDEGESEKQEGFSALGFFKRTSAGLSEGDFDGVCSALGFFKGTSAGLSEGDFDGICK